MKRLGWLVMFPAMLLVVNPLSELTDWQWPVKIRSWWESF